MWGNGARTLAVIALATVGWDAPADAQSTRRRSAAKGPRAATTSRAHRRATFRGPGSYLSAYLRAPLGSRDSLLQRIGRSLLRRRVVDQHVVGVGRSQVLRLGLRREEAAYFRHYYPYDDLAAFRLSHALHLTMVAPTFGHRFDGRAGSIQVEVAGPDGRQLASRRAIRYPNRTTVPWGNRNVPATQQANARALHFLYGGWDTDATNWRVATDDAGGRHLVMYDFVGAFGTSIKTAELRRIRTIGRALYRRLKAIDEREIRAALSPLRRRWSYGALEAPRRSREHIDAVVKRRDLLVKHIERLIARHGADAVLLD